MGLWSFFLIFFKLIKNINGSEIIMDTNNLSTIATFLAICITGILAYFGYTVDQAQLATVLMSVITLIIAIWSSKNPNTLAILGNAPTPVESEETVLNDEYEV
jgi:EamA domain-containing membrane protein RarD